jgi:hypothetical protein
MKELNTTKSFQVKEIAITLKIVTLSTIINKMQHTAKHFIMAGIWLSCMPFMLGVVYAKCH